MADHDDLDDSFQDRIVDQLKKGMEHNRTFYLRSIDRTITIEWEDESKNIVKIIDCSFEEFVPFKSDGRIKWRHTFSAGSNQTNDDYSQTMSVSVDGKKINPKKQGDGADNQVVYEYTMKGKPIYRVLKRIERNWDISADPLIVYISRHIVESLRIEINCIPDNVRPFFEEHHLINKFLVQPNSAEDARPFDYVTKCSEPILPGDGFSICLIKNS